jgi:hypothetical protein
MEFLMRQYVARNRFRRRPTAPYTPALIEDYCARQLTGTVKSRGKTRSALRRLGRMLAPERWADPAAAHATSEVLPPYSDGELDTMVRHTTDLHTIERLLDRIAPRPADQAVAWLTRGGR